MKIVVLTALYVLAATICPAGVILTINPDLVGGPANGTTTLFGSIQSTEAAVLTLFEQSLGRPGPAQVSVIDRLYPDTLQPMETYTGALVTLQLFSTPGDYPDHAFGVGFRNALAEEFRSEDTFTVAITDIPEPSTFGFVSITVAMLLVGGRFRRPSAID